MFKYLKIELLKSKRSTNVRITFILPIIFILFNLLLMFGIRYGGKSILMATAFNWAPTLITPIVLSLFVANIVLMEKPYMIGYQRSLNVNFTLQFIAKVIVVLFQLLIQFLISSTLVYLIGVYILHEPIQLTTLVYATIIEFVSILPVVSFSFILINLFKKKYILILINFILSFIAPLIATYDTWIYFFYSYCLRMIAPIIMVHPNGTFLDESSYLNNLHTTYTGILLSFILFILFTWLNTFLERRKQYV